MTVTVRIFKVCRHSRVTSRYWGTIVENGEQTRRWCKVKFDNSGKTPESFIGTDREFDDGAARGPDGSILYFEGRNPPDFTYEKQGPKEITRLEGGLLGEIPLPFSGPAREKPSFLDKCTELLEANYNLVLTGAPGTGKTFLARQIAEKMTGTRSGGGSGQTGFVQFHPSYDYTDFVEGLRPVTGGESGGAAGFELQSGIFKAFCKEALSASGKKFVFIIDEINRGEISKIFGELFFSVDPAYRGEKGRVRTQYTNLIPDGDIFKKGFYIPENVYLIGAMNDIDRSVESFDFAMRRRFVWQEITAAESAKNMNLPSHSKKRMAALNEAIEGIEGLNAAYHIGGAYFLKPGADRDYEWVWEHHLEPLLAEYVRGMPGAREKLDSLKEAYTGEPGRAEQDDPGSLS
jgi:hypothetical protein